LCAHGTKALSGFSSFRPGTNFRSWIYKILRNAFLTSRTGLEATASVPLDLENEEEILPEVKETPCSILLRVGMGRLFSEQPGATAGRLSRGAVAY